MPSTPPPPRPIGPLAAAVAGIAAAVAGLATGELVAGLSPSLDSPVISIGNRVVDAVPRWLKDLAIAAFGTNDKVALVAGIVVVLALAAAGLGVLARGRPRLAAVGATLLGLVGVVSAGLAPAGGGPEAILPSLATTAVAVPTLVWLVQGRVDAAWRAPSPRAIADPPGDPSMRGPTAATDPDGTAPMDRIELRDGNLADSSSRRHLLVTSSVVAASALVAGLGRRLGRRFDVGGERDRLTLPAPDEAAPTTPTAPAPDVDGLSSFVTPNDDFYRIDTALTVPQLSSDGWTLRVHGLVEEERTFGYDEVLAMPSVERVITMTCVSNQVGGDLVGTARWQGVALADVLDHVGVDPSATQLVGRAFDGWTAGFPVAEVADRESLLVYGMNGQPLPEVHGFPLRLVTPGLYGYVSATKWLSELELTTFDAFDPYWIEREWDRRGPVKTSSRIDTPAGFASLTGTVAVAGVAWAQTRGVERVEVRVDDGDFEDADLADDVGDDTWRQWVWPWDTTTVEPGRHTLTVRATDRTGQVQTEERAEPFPNGSTGWHSVAVFTGEDA